jgi:uncharacterized protein YqgC (DUF456 family)
MARLFVFVMCLVYPMLPGVSGLSILDWNIITTLQKTICFLYQSYYIIQKCMHTIFLRPKYYIIENCMLIISLRQKYYIVKMCRQTICIHFSIMYNSFIQGSMARLFVFVMCLVYPMLPGVSGLSILDCPFVLPGVSGLSILDCPFSFL